MVEDEAAFTSSHRHQSDRARSERSVKTENAEPQLQTGQLNLTRLLSSSILPVALDPKIRTLTWTRGILFGSLENWQRRPDLGSCRITTSSPSSLCCCPQSGRQREGAGNVSDRCCCYVLGDFQSYVVTRLLVRSSSGSRDPRRRHRRRRVSFPRILIAP